MKVALLIPALALLAPMSLQADAARFGVEVFGSAPAAGLKDNYTSNAIGFGAGLFAEWELSRGNTIRLLFDQGTVYGSKNVPASLGLTNGPASTFRTDMKTTRYFFGPEFHLSLSGSQQGAYLLAGLGLGRVESMSGAIPGVSFNRNGDNGLSNSLRFYADSGTRLQWALGAGYRLNSDWDVKVRYSSVASHGRQLGSVDFGVDYRF